jgi:hypothetical protein
MNCSDCAAIGGAVRSAPARHPGDPLPGRSSVFGRTRLGLKQASGSSES